METKYLPSYTKVVFSEVPDEISLAISFTNCTHRCPDCHSKELWEDIGEVFTMKTLNRLIKENEGITCVCFMGDPERVARINSYCKYIKGHFPSLKTAWYTGSMSVPPALNLQTIDYLKVGPYNKKYGPLTNPKTNQKLYEIFHSGTNINIITDITNKFWKKV